MCLVILKRKEWRGMGKKEDVDMIDGYQCLQTGVLWEEGQEEKDGW